MQMSLKSALAHHSIVALAIGFILLLIGRRKFQHDVKNLRKISLDRT